MSFPKYCLLGIVLLLAGLFIPMPFTVNSAATKALTDVVHLPLFGGLTAGAWFACRRLLKLSVGRALLLVLMAGGLFAFGSEWLQGLLGRDPSLGDAVNNLFGLGAALAGLLAWEQRSKIAAAACVALLGAGLWIALTPVVNASRAADLQNARLPVIGDFEHDWELILWQAQGDKGGGDTTIRRSDQHAESGEFSLRIETHGAEWAGVFLLAAGSDWSGHEALCFRLRDDGPPWTLGVRIDTKNHGRFTGSVDLDSGVNDCVVPFAEIKNSKGDSISGILTEVERLVLHADKSGHRGTIFLDNVRLE